MRKIKLKIRYQHTGTFQSYKNCVGKSFWSSCFGSCCSVLLFNVCLHRPLSDTLWLLVGRDSHWWGASHRVGEDHHAGHESGNGMFCWPLPVAERAHVHEAHFFPSTFTNSSKVRMVHISKVTGHQRSLAYHIWADLKHATGTHVLVQPDPFELIRW